MDHRSLSWLQTELSKAFSQIIGKEVNLSPEQALEVVSVMTRYVRRKSVGSCS
jgi:hypothetical protein